jgi:hypothetical protein
MARIWLASLAGLGAETRRHQAYKMPSKMWDISLEKGKSIERSPVPNPLRKGRAILSIGGAEIRPVQTHHGREHSPGPQTMNYGQILYRNLGPTNALYKIWEFQKCFFFML